MGFKENIKLAREAYKLNQKQMAEMLVIDSAGYRSWENGRTEPKLNSLVLVAKKLRVSLDALVSDEPLKVKVIVPKFRLDLVGNEISLICSKEDMTQIVISFQEQLGCWDPEDEDTHEMMDLAEAMVARLKELRPVLKIIDKT